MIFCRTHISGSRVQGSDVHRHPRVLHRQEDHGHDARQEGHLPQLRAGVNFIQNF